MCCIDVSQNIRDQLRFSVENINDSINALTLENSFHEDFGTFRFALEPTVCMPYTSQLTHVLILLG
jgi:hypothetical protein